MDMHLLARCLKEEGEKGATEEKTVEGDQESDGEGVHLSH